MSLINPYTLFKRGYIIKGRPQNLTPNGYDLRVKGVYEITTDLDSILIADDKNIKKRAYGILRPRRLNNHKLYYFLKKFVPYEIRTIESVYIPKDMVGLIFSRSSFNRAGIIIRGTLFDSGFRGTPSLTIYPFLNMYLAKESRVAQIIFVKAESYRIYKGKYNET